MSLSYWNKHDKRVARQNKLKEIEKGADYALCPKRKKQDRYLPAAPFKLLLNALNEKKKEEDENI